jgi:hypothetical protein
MATKTSPRNRLFCNIHSIHPKNKYSTSSVLELMNASTISSPITYIKKTRRNSSVTPPKIGTQEMQKNQNQKSSIKTTQQRSTASFIRGKQREGGKK